jgi:hypothetical protein
MPIDSIILLFSVSKHKTADLIYGSGLEKIKGTVSPEFVFYFRVYKFKSVLLVRPHMVFKSVYFVDL